MLNVPQSTLKWKIQICPLPAFDILKGIHAVRYMIFIPTRLKARPPAIVFIPEKPYMQYWKIVYAVMLLLYMYMYT